MKPWPHQLECLQRAVAENTIVNMPTGTGKTLVAVLAIDHFRTSGRIIFLVPTRPLVLQQAEYIRKNCARTMSVKELQGAQTDHLSAADWKDIVSVSDVLVGTAEVFRRALVDTKFLSLSSFSLIIFDECHNATGNSPMAAIMRDSVHRCLGRAPRILGLTASFVHGSLTGIEMKRKDLEGLLQSRLFCPSVEERPMEFEQVSYTQSVVPAMEQVVESKVTALLSVAEKCGVPLKETKKVIQRGAHVFSELGLAAFIYYLRECVAPQIQMHLETLAEVLPAGYRVGPARSAAESIPRLRQEMRDAAQRLANDGTLTAFPNVTDKAKTLLALLQTLQRGGSGKQTRVIIFCEQTVLAHPLAHLLQQHTGCRTGTCTGVGSMTDGERRTALLDFRRGAVPLLTCTAALEEGLDVSECEVVVRFSQFRTTKSHVQGSGRARAWNARVFYFENDPTRELAGAALMERTAKESSLSLSDAELQTRRAHADVVGVHPYHTGAGAEISIFNCVQMVYEYAARCMGASFRPEESMLSYREELVCAYPPLRRKSLVAVTVPSPEGFFDVPCAAVDAHWGAVDLDDMAEKKRMRNWEPLDRELRRFLYVVAVELSKRGFLDGNNQPSARALRETRLSCEARRMRPGARIAAKYDPSGLSAQGVAPQVSTGGSGLPPHVAVALCGGRLAPPTRPGPAGSTPLEPPIDRLNGLSFIDAAAQRGDAQTAQVEENQKGRLNEATRGAAAYATLPEEGGFRSIVVLPDGRRFCGAVASSKKQAEQLAAAAAMAALSPSAPPAIVIAAAAAALVTSGKSLGASRTASGGTSGSLVDEGLLTRVLAELRRSDVVTLAELVRRCDVPKKEVNQQLYRLELSGQARKVMDSPPLWTAIS